ncbi:MAG: RNA 2',3'-cyclic phosphodiesterase [Actinomycetota bacterium]|nr:RNA 2',3'-cyclic phosphodiesterase [Actinomycetota bacterium]
MRLFTALWPPADALDVLADTVTAVAEPAGWRRVPRERWHLTLAFHGEDDPDRMASELDELTGAAAPRLRLAGAGSFPGVLWAGLETLEATDRAALDALVAGAGGDPGTFVAHLTLARRSGGRRGRPALPDVPPGPWWSPSEVLLVASERDATGIHYRPVHRVPLTVPVATDG